MYVCVYVCVCVCVCWALSRAQLFVTPWTVPTKLLCPWNSPDKNTGMGCHFLLQGIFLTQGSNQLSCTEADSLPSEPPGKCPKLKTSKSKISEAKLRKSRLSVQRRQWHPTPVFLPGESHGRRSLVGCSPWGGTESDVTEVT